MSGAATAVLVIAAIACLPAAEQEPPKPTEKTGESPKPIEPAFEVLVQYREGTKDTAKVAVRKSVNGKLKEKLDSPSGASGLEVLLVPRSKRYDSVEQVVSELRRNKAVRIVEPQQIYSKQSSGRH